MTKYATYDAMTGAAQTSSSNSILRRPRAVRRAMSPATGLGIACTVKASGDASSAMLASGPDELEPDIQTRHQGGKRKPLECIAVVLLQIERRKRPVAPQPVGAGVGSIGLQQRKRQQRDAQFAGVGIKVEILPDGSAGGGR